MVLVFEAEIFGNLPDRQIGFVQQSAGFFHVYSVVPFLLLFAHFEEEMNIPDFGSEGIALTIYGGRTGSCGWGGIRKSGCSKARHRA